MMAKTGFQIGGQIERAVEAAIESLACASAAQCWSTPGDVLKDEHGDDVVCVAEFGEWTAVNGDILWNSKNPGKLLPGKFHETLYVPTGHVEVDGGGYIPLTEEEVCIETIADVAARKLGIEATAEFVTAVAEHFGKDVAYWSVSGRSMTFAKGAPVGAGGKP